MSGITVDQWVRISGRTYRRARKLEDDLREAALVVASAGKISLAETLLDVADRAMPCATAHIQRLSRGVAL